MEAAARKTMIAKPDIPETMRAAAIDRFGGPEVISTHTLPVPRPNAQEVLIKLQSAGVGLWDAHMRDGSWVVGKKRFPFILGIDGAGTVAAVGARVKRFAVGDFVYAYSYTNRSGGFYAEYAAVAAGKVAPVPAGFDAIHVGGFPTLGLTALQGVDNTLKVKDGESVIVHGASGNVGMIALQFVKLRGARVLATASGADGVDLVRRLGADEVVDGKHDDITAVARRFAPNGIDAVLAFVGGEELTRCLDAVRDGGRVAYPNGIEPEPRKRKGLKIKSYDAENEPRHFEQLNAAMTEGRIEVPIAEVFPLEEARRAHERLARGHILGKIVLDVAR